MINITFYFNNITKGDTDFAGDGLSAFNKALSHMFTLHEEDSEYLVLGAIRHMMGSSLYPLEGTACCRASRCAYIG